MGAKKRTFRLKDLYAVRTLSSVTATPDGRMAAFVAAQPDARSNKNKSEIWVWEEGRGEHQVTFDGKASMPRFSPRGDRLAYLSDRVGEKNQVYVMCVGLSEGRRVTDFESGAVGFEWSPDGRRLAVVARADKTPAEKKKETDKLDGWVYDRDEPRQQLFVVSADGSGKPRRVSLPAEHVASAAWFPDGRRLAYASCPLAQLDCQWYRSVLKVAGADGRARRTVCLFLGHTVGARLFISRDGRQALLMEAFDRRNLWHDVAKVVDLATGRKKLVAAGFDLASVNPQWLGDGRVLFESGEGTTYGFYAGRPGERPRKVVGGPGVAAFPAVAEKARRVFFIYCESGRPDELRAAPLDGSAPPVSLTRMNAGLSSLRLAEARVVRWKQGDRDMEGMLYLPSQRRARRPYPLVVMPHGGPYGASANSYTGANVPNVFCAAGYACFLPNFRGSTGYGRRFTNSNLGDWGDGPFRDIMAGVDALIRRGIADGRRLAVFGGSYGGYMTAWAVGHTRRFRAAVAVAAVTNNLSMWGTTDVPSFMVYSSKSDRAGFTGRFWRDQSPLHHADRVRTPTLILTGEVDLRVPPEQSHEFYRALRARGVETRLVLYPREAHGVLEPRHRLHYFREILDWINGHALAR